jgi:hypothetical protein
MIGAPFRFRIFGLGLKTVFPSRRDVGTRVALIPTCGLHCGENCVGLERKQAVIGVYCSKDNELRSAVNVSECRYNETGALLGCRFHNPTVGIPSDESVPQRKSNPRIRVANTWTKITARDAYAMVTNGKETENP